MKNLNFYLLIILLISIFVSYGAIKRNLNVSKENSRLNENLNSLKREYLTEKDNYAISARAYETNLKELRRINFSQVTKLSDYQLKLKAANDKIKELGLRLKDVESVITGGYNSEGIDTVYLTQVDSVYILTPVDDGYLKGQFTRQSLSSGFNLSSPFSTGFVFDYTYHDDLTITVSREKIPFRDRSGGFLHRLKPQYREISTATTENKKARYDHDLIIIK